MLTLLKQARAFGLGVVLATQNPVDLDYKGLANIGTWFLGRLQTERDRDRLLEGLASAAGGFDRDQAERTLASLEKRTFLMQNVHEDGPVVLQSRWALSYLRGPLTLEQLKKLAGSPAPADERPTPEAATPSSRPRPAVPSSVSELFLGSGGAIYQPGLLGTVRLHYVAAAHGIDRWETLHWFAPFEETEGEPSWGRGEEAPARTADQPDSGVDFAELPSTALYPKSYERWEKSLKDFLYRERKLPLFTSKPLRLKSIPGESDGDFRARAVHRLREIRDEEREALRKKFAPQLQKVQEAIRRAEARVERESSQFQGRALDTAVDFGLTLAGALFGRKIGSVASARRAGETARSASRAASERGDVTRAQEELQAQKEKLARMEAELSEKTAALAAASEPQIQTLSIAPRKADIRVEKLALLWKR
jgi:hypothetical protein